MRVEAADVLLKVLEEPPTDTVFLLLSARPDDLPDTVRSRCQEIGFPPLSESFVIETLVREGLDEDRARLASRLAGGNVGRARRLARAERVLGFRLGALVAGERAEAGPAGALAAAEMVTKAAKEFRAHLGDELAVDLEPYLDERGKPEDPFRGMVRRIEEQHERRLRRAEREFYDWALLSLEAYWRDVAVLASGGSEELLINLDRPGGLSSAGRDMVAAALAMGAVEEARADLADETNLNPRLILERMFLLLSSLQVVPG
jgi:DNA polymerase-3 subunit delta'